MEKLQVGFKVYLRKEYAAFSKADTHKHNKPSSSNKSPAPAAALVGDWKTQTTGPLGSRQKHQLMMIKQRTSSEMLTKPAHTSYSCTPGDAKIRFLCAPAGEFQQHRHRWHFRRLRRAGKLRRGTGHLPDGPQHLRRAAALGVPPRLPPQLTEGQVRVGLLSPRDTWETDWILQHYVVPGILTLLCEKRWTEILIIGLQQEDFLWGYQRCM